MDVSECAEEDEPRLGYFVYWIAVTKIAKSENILCSASKAKIYNLFVNRAINLILPPPRKVRNILLYSYVVLLVKMFYDENECSIITESGIGPWFTVKSGVKQGCVMSGFLFILAVDWIMRQTVARNNTGIQWTFTEKLEDLDYADDIVTMSNSWTHAQQKVKRLSLHGKGIGLNINKGKTKTLRINANRDYDEE